MRGLVSVLLTLGILFGIYYFYLKQMPVTDKGTAPTQAISLTGVRSDLLQIAQSERTFTTHNGHCASLDELVSSNTMTMSRSGREGDSYSVDCAGSNFTPSPTRPPSP